MIIQGSDLMLFCDLDSKGYKSIGGATSHTLDIQMDLNELTSKDFGSGRWKMQSPGSLSFTISSDNYVIDKESIGDASSNSTNARCGFGFDDVFDAMVTRKPIKVCFALEANSENLWEGKQTEAPTDGWTPRKNRYEAWAYINSLSQNAPSGDYASYSVQLTGHGALTKVGTVMDSSTTSNPKTASLAAETPVAVTKK